MIHYFKYTQGDAFTLNGSDYKGMVHVIDNAAFTDATPSITSKPLTSKGTFASQFILTKGNYNLPSFTDKLKTSISSINVYPRATLNIETLSNIFDTLHKNNVFLYSSGVRYNPNMFNVLYKSQENQSSIFTLSAKTSQPKSQYLPLNVSPLTALEVQNVDAITQNLSTNGSLFISQGNEYKYYNNNITCNSFARSLCAVVFADGFNSGDFTHDHLFYNRYDNVIYQTNQENFTIFSYDFRSPTNTVSLIDRIDLTPTGTATTPYNASYSRNYRACIAINQGVFTVEIFPTNTTELAKRLSPEDIGVDSVLRIAQRFEDDLLVVLGLKDGVYVLAVYDIIDLITKNTKPVILPLTDVTETPTWIELCEFDSDLIFLKYYDSRGAISSLQARSLSNPTITIFSITNDNVYTIFVNNIINEITTPINLARDIVFRNTTPQLLDIQFNTNNEFLSFVLSDHYILTDNRFPLDEIIPSNTICNYVGVDIDDNSIGLSMNAALKNIIQDTITLYYILTERFTSFINTTTDIPDITVDDFYIYGNESINVPVLNRIIDKIYKMQSTLADRLSL